jgi:hydrogenase nickel incorporation protein HypB
MSEPRLVEVRRNVLKQNDVIAHALRTQFRAAGVFVVSLVSSPGSGKTTFLEKTLTQLQPRYGWQRWLAIWRPRTTRCDWRAAKLR